MMRKKEDETWGRKEAMDGYEDMFKEITRKLYGEEVEAAEYDDLAAALAGQGGGTGTTTPSSSVSWVQSDEALPWSASKVAAYSPQQKLFRCVECGDCVGVLARVAEHWVAAHAAPGHGWAARCVRVDDVSRFLQRLRARADRGGGGAAHQQVANTGTSKRYCCNYCPYATDRRDLFTRHENIHREEKPFQCYVCHKQFNRADHVKKHFLRMHRDFPYDLNRIRRTPARSSSSSSSYTQHRPQPPLPPPPQASYQPHQQHHHGSNNNKPRRKGDKRYACCYCPWSGADNWCLKRHLNTHLKPFACLLCEYKAARQERLATHVLKVHNKRACGRCAFLAEDAAHLQAHVADHHPWEQRNGGGSLAAAMDAASFGARVKSESGARRQHCGAERLFHYLEASDDDDEDHRPQQQEEETPPPAVCPDCGCEFLDAASLETHALTHRARAPPPPAQSKVPPPGTRRTRRRRKVAPPPYRCAVCGGGRATQAAMLEHMRSHGAGAVLRCRSQGCAFATACGREALRDHVAVTHLGGRPNSNGTGDDVVTTTAKPPPSSVTRRRRRPRRPQVAQRRRRRLGLRCPQCPRRPLTAASLALHLAWRHAAPAFSCEHCPRAFRRRYQVVLHASREHVALVPAAAPTIAAPAVLNVPRVPTTL